MTKHVNFSRHGGGCCGVSCLYEFGFIDSDDGTYEVPGLPYFDGDVVAHTKDNGRCVEVILVDQQITAMPHLVGMMKHQGFELVNRFYNSNSENYCNVLHLTRDEDDRESLMKDSPFHMVEPYNPAAVEPAPVELEEQDVEPIQGSRKKVLPINPTTGRQRFVVVDGLDAHYFPLGTIVEIEHGMSYRAVLYTEMLHGGEDQTQLLCREHIRPL